MESIKKIIAIGGSAGSLPVLLSILQNLQPGYKIPIVVILHRLKNVPTEIDKIVIRTRADLEVREPEDKEPITNKYIYIAPANYHLLTEADGLFSLDDSELVNYSRPSIDVSFESIAVAFGSRATAILLSGANSDGSDGLKKIINQGGTAIVQSLQSSEYPVMPAAAIKMNPSAKILSPAEISIYLQQLNEI